MIYLKQCLQYPLYHSIFLRPKFQRLDFEPHDVVLHTFRYVSRTWKEVFASEWYLPNSSQERFVEESLTSSLELYYVLCNYSSQHLYLLFSCQFPYHVRNNQFHMPNCSYFWLYLYIFLLLLCSFMLRHCACVFGWCESLEVPPATSQIHRHSA